MTERNSDASSLEKARGPDFMIVGAMKSGTTTLHSYLARHPRVYLCSPKEPAFFSRQEVYARGLEWYFSLFAGARADQICGEASTCYSRWPYFGDVAGRIREAVPEARFIYVMRHPVARAYSHYRHEMEERLRHGRGGIVTFEQALEEEPVILETSFYRRQIERFLARFPRERILLLFFEDLEARPGPVLDEVQRFLGLEPSASLLESEVVANPFGSRMSKTVMTARLDAFRRTSAGSAAAKLLPRRVRAWVRSRFTDSAIAGYAMRRQIESLKRQLTPLEVSVRKRLLPRFAAANHELGELMGRRVPASWQE